jgi:hypothetical protein
VTNATKRTALLNVALIMGLACVASAQQVSPVQASLVIPDAKLLPGVPFDMWIDVRNPSDSAVTVGLFPRLSVRTDGGVSFEIRPQPDDFPVLLRGSRAAGSPIIRYLTLAPGGKQTLTLPIEEWLAGTQFLRDARLSPPGHYTLSIRLDAFPGVTDPATLTFLGPVITSEATVERIEPTGADAKVWNRMQQLGNGRWAVLPPVATSGATAAETASMWSVCGEIIAKDPDSNYLPYALIANAGVSDKYLKLITEAIGRFPSSPLIELISAKSARSDDRIVWLAQFSEVSPVPARVGDGRALQTPNHPHPFFWPGGSLEGAVSTRLRLQEVI